MVDNIENKNDCSSYENTIFEEVENFVGLKELFDEEICDNLTSPREENVSEDLDQYETEPESEPESIQNEEDHQIWVHPELQSIFSNFDEFVSSNSTVKKAVLDEEPGYNFRRASSSFFDLMDDYCNICMGHERSVAQCSHCSTITCFDCLTQYLEYGVLDGVIKFTCPSEDNCSKILSDQLVSAFIKPELNAILTKNKVEADKNPNVKTCPSCHKVVKKTSIKRQTKSQEQKSKVNCSCGTSWCFTCYSPWHHGLSCKTYQKDVLNSGEKALRFWAKSNKKGRKTAKKCPKCKIYIERIAGCDHMYCKRCKTDFCYRCGGKHYNMGLLGDHFSTYSFLGCKYNLHPNKPVLRIAKRAGVTTGVVLVSPLILTGFTVAAVCFLPYVAFRKCRK